MAVAITGLPVTASPGAVLSGTITCTNTGAAIATNASCVASAGVPAGATVTTGVCVASSGTAAALPAAATLICPITVTMPGTPGGTDTPETTVGILGTTNATNDTNAANNTTTTPINVIDAVNDAAGGPGGAVGQTTNVGTNDQFPVGSTFTIQPGSTCIAPSVSATGVATYNVPASGSCTVNYQVCAPAPNATQCDTATLTVTAISGANASKVFVPPIIAVGGSSVMTITLVNTNAFALTGATLVDNYPAGMRNATAPAATTTCAGGTVTATPNGNLLSLSGGTIPANATCTVSVSVTSSTNGSLVNTIPAGAITTTNGGNNTSPVTGTLTVAPIPTSGKFFQPSVIDRGGISTLTIVLLNSTGVPQALTAPFTDNMPPGIAVGSGSNFGTCSNVTVTSTSITKASGSTIPNGGCTIVVSVSGSITGVLENVTSPLQTSLGVGAPSIATLSVLAPPIPVLPADIAIQKNGPLTAAPGSTVIYTLIVSNSGPGAADGATYRDILPAALAGTVSAVCGNPSGGATCSSPVVQPGAVSGSVPQMPSGGSVTITITATAPASGTLNNSAIVSTPPGVTDSDPTNNTSNVVTTRITQGVPNIADVSITKTASSAVAANGTISYILSVVNSGPGAADGSIVTDNLPAGLTSVTALCQSSTGGASCSAPGVLGSTFSATIGTLPANATVTYRINAKAPATGTLTNTASVQTPPSIIDPTPTNNTSSITSTVVPPGPTTNLSVVKLGPAQALPGSTVSYRITISNNGPDAADGSTYSDAVPAVLSNVAVTCGSPSAGAVCGANAANVAGNLVTGTIGKLPAGSSVVITISGKAPNTPSRFANLVTVATPIGVIDTDPSDNIGGPVITQIPVAAVEGRVWLDSNHNRTRETGETLLAGWKVELISPSGAIVGTAITDEKGFYRITGVPPGNGYKLVFRNPVVGTTYGSPVNGETPGTQIPAVGTYNPATFSNAMVGAGIVQSIDLIEGVTAVEQSLPIDPTGVVYDSETRQPVAGAQVCVDGPSGFNPVTQLVSGMRCVTTGTDGMYQFLFTSFGSGGAPAGNYTITVLPPTGYTAPSTAFLPNGTLTVPGPTTTNLLVQNQSTAPQQGQATTYYLQFTFGSSSGGVVNNHIPIDPKASGSVLINKVASINAAELGDSIQYTIKVSNANNTALAGSSVRDSLPAGFKYIPGTLRINGARSADPVGVGPQIRIPLPAIAAGATIELTYFVRLAVGSAQGDGINRAQVFLGDRAKSNIASAKVKVTGGVLGTDACIIGKVFIDCDGNHMQNNRAGGNEFGIPGVRLVMETGAYAVTDGEGKYSICPVTPHTHVVRVDSRSLPKGAIMLPSSNRNAGDGLSMFADVKNGDLFRADFIEGSCSAEVLNDVKERRKRTEAPSRELDRPDQTGGRNTGSLPSGLQPTARP